MTEKNSDRLAAAAMMLLGGSIILGYAHLKIAMWVLLGIATALTLAASTGETRRVKGQRRSGADLDSQDRVKS